MNKPTREQLAELNGRIAELCGSRGKHPDYTDSLDAIHEVERSPVISSWLRYETEVERVVQEGWREIGVETHYASSFPIHASAWQRAIALDRTLSNEPLL